MYVYEKQCTLTSEKHDCPLFSEDTKGKYVPVEIYFDDIDCLEQLLKTKKLTQKQRCALHKLLLDFLDK